MNKINYPKIKIEKPINWTSWMNVVYPFVDNNYINNDSKELVSYALFFIKDIIDLEFYNQTDYCNDLKKYISAVGQDKEFLLNEIKKYYYKSKFNIIYYSYNHVVNNHIYIGTIFANIYISNQKSLDYLIKLISAYKRTKKQFNIKYHNNTYHESILKQIINTEYEKLEEVDKNQIIDIINEFYNIEINEFDFLTHKTIQREFDSL